MKPGVTARPDASMTQPAWAADKLPSAAIFPAVMPTSARKPGRPVPSMTVPPRIMVSNMVSPLYFPCRQGRVMVKRVVLPPLSQRMAPRWVSTMALAMDRPSPKLPPSVRDSSAR